MTSVAGLLDVILRMQVRFSLVPMFMCGKCGTIPMKYSGPCFSDPGDISCAVQVPKACYLNLSFQMMSSLQQQFNSRPEIMMTDAGSPTALMELLRMCLFFQRLPTRTTVSPVTITAICFLLR